MCPHCFWVSIFTGDKGHKAVAAVAAGIEAADRAEAVDRAVDADAAVAMTPLGRRMPSF